jgi:hypothetical protein
VPPFEFIFKILKWIYKNIIYKVVIFLYEVLKVLIFNITNLKFIFVNFYKALRWVAINIVYKVLDFIFQILKVELFTLYKLDYINERLQGPQMDCY